MDNKKYIQAKKLFFKYDCFQGTPPFLADFRFKNYKIPKQVMRLWVLDYINEELIPKIENSKQNSGDYNAIIKNIKVKFSYYLNLCIYGELNTDEECISILSCLNNFLAYDIFKIILSYSNLEYAQRDLSIFQNLLISIRKKATIHFLDNNGEYEYDGILSYFYYSGKIDEMNNIIDICFNIIDNGGTFALSSSLYSFINKFLPNRLNDFYSHYNYSKDYLENGYSLFEFFVDKAYWKNIIPNYSLIEESFSKIRYLSMNYHGKYPNLYEEKHLSIDYRFDYDYLLKVLNLSYELFSMVNDDKIQALYILGFLCNISYFIHIDINSSIYVDEYKSQIDCAYDRIFKILISKEEKNGIFVFDGLIPKFFDQNYYLYSMTIFSYHNMRSAYNAKGVYGILKV